MTLTEFLLSRIAEDEQDAYDWRTTRRSHYDRVIDDCEAKRRIVERGHEVVTKAVDSNRVWTEADSALIDTLRLLALPYADHPDYREEWRP